MHYPTNRKGADGKSTIRRANIEDRQDAIKHIGKESFYSNKDYEYLWDKPIPCCFLWIFNVFLELYGASTEVGGMATFRNVTWQDIESYCHVRDLRLSQLELSYLVKIRNWVNDEIAILEKEE